MANVTLYHPSGATNTVMESDVGYWQSQGWSPSQQPQQVVSQPPSTPQPVGSLPMATSIGSIPTTMNTTQLANAQPLQVASSQPPMSASAVFTAGLPMSTSVGSAPPIQGQVGFGQSTATGALEQPAQPQFSSTPTPPAPPTVSPELATAQAEQKGFLQQLKDVFSSLAGKETRQVAKQEELGLSANVQKLQELNTQYAAKQAEIAAFDNEAIKQQQALAQQQIPQGLVIGQQRALAQQQEDTRRTKSIELGAMSMQQQALQGNITLAQNIAKQTVDLEFAPQERKIEEIKTFLEINQATMNAAEKKQAQQVSDALELQKAQIADARQAKEDEYKQMIDAANLELKQAELGLKAQEAAQGGTAEKLAPGIIGEYQFYAQQEQKAGRKVLSFNEYQNLDQNRKLSIAKASIPRATGLTSQQTTHFLRITDKFQADKVMENGNRGSGAITIANQVIANPGSAGNQLKVLYTLVKSLDPDSAVREGELALAARTQSYLGLFGNTLERINAGKLITNEAAKELATATKELAQIWFDSAKRREKQYLSQASVAGVGDAFNQYLSGFEKVYSVNKSDGLTDDDAFKEYQKLKQNKPLIIPKGPQSFNP